MPTEYVDTYYKRTLSDPQTRYPALAGRKRRGLRGGRRPGRPVGRAGTGPARPAGHAAGRQPHRLGRLGPQRRLGLARVPAPTPSAAMWTRIITARFTGCRWRAWRSSAPTSATWTSATPTRSTAACAWCATTPATRCSAGAMNSSGFRARRARAVARPAARAAGDRGLFPGRGRSHVLPFPSAQLRARPGAECAAGRAHPRGYAGAGWRWTARSSRSPPPAGVEARTVVLATAATPARCNPRCDGPCCPSPPTSC